MKIVCVDNDGGWEDFLTLGKTYDVIYNNKYCYNILNDNGDDDWFNNSRFKILTEIRNDKINKLLGL
jgi:hypothetical protein